MLGLTLVSYFQFFNKNNFIKFFSQCRYHSQNPHQGFSSTAHLKLPTLNFFWGRTFWHFSVFQRLSSWGRAWQDCKKNEMRTNCLCYNVTHSMAVVPATISSITSSEQRLRGLLYFGVFTLVPGYFSHLRFSQIVNQNYPGLADCGEESNLQPGVQTSPHGLLVVNLAILLSHLDIVRSYQRFSRSVLTRSNKKCQSRCHNQLLHY